MWLNLSSTTAFALLIGFHAVNSIPPDALSRCRSLPSDAGWPKPAVWDKLNDTVGGRLIAGIPLGQPCFEPLHNEAECNSIKAEWTQIPPFLADAVNVMSPYWQNNSCNPFHVPARGCALGNMAVYSINISCAQDLIAGIRFARTHNIRLTIKNTGHDFLGRSAGAGSLGLWTHNLKDIKFFKYSSPSYTGPAVRLGAGVEGSDLLSEAAAKGYRVVSGSCPTVGITGGFSQGGGHSPLSSRYGLGADQVLEWEVVTAKGRHITASPTQNRDLYWALRGGGAGNYAVVLSMTAKAYPDGPVAGAGFVIMNDNNDRYWAAIAAWLKHLLVLEKSKGYSTGFTITAQAFQLAFALLPDATSTEEIMAPLAPFFAELDAMDITVSQKRSALSSNYAEWFHTWAEPVAYSTNNALGGRLIPRSTIQGNLTSLVAVLRDIIEVCPTDVPWSAINGVSLNVNSARTDPKTSQNVGAVLPAWREAIFTLNFGIPINEDATLDTLQSGQAWINSKQNKLRKITPRGGTYMNEASFDNPNWKEDYFGVNYETLLGVKKTYDPENLFWAPAAVGSDAAWVLARDGRLCRPEFHLRK